MKYQLVRSAAAEGLEKKVQAELAKGWQLHGTPFSARVHDQERTVTMGGIQIPEALYQAMVKEE
jgi:hypothetical protein